MKRAAIERSRTTTVWRKHWGKHVREHLMSGGQRQIACACDLQVNRFRKGQRQGGCGRPQCMTCHGEKILGIQRHRDRKRELMDGCE